MSDERWPTVILLGSGSVRWDAGTPALGGSLSGILAMDTCQHVLILMAEPWACPNGGTGCDAHAPSPSLEQESTSHTETRTQRIARCLEFPPEWIAVRFT